MKKQFILKIMSVLLLAFFTLQKAQTTSENYVQSKTCLSEDCVKKTETITYFDGLGRPKQVISVRATPQGQDLVVPVTYDHYGRQLKDILPVPAPSMGSGYHSGITNENAANTYYGSTNAFSEKQIENSPLDRLLQEAKPGDSWKLSSGHTKKYRYETNADKEVLKFITVTTINTVNGVSNTVSSLSVSPDDSGSYPAGVLYKNTVTDEDGNPVTQFLNGRGQVVLIRRTDGTNNADTYYVYNEYSQNVFVIPPKAVQQIGQNSNSISQNILDDLCYRYSYDGRKRVVEKKLPGKGWEYMVYDKADRLVLTQDANLRKSGEWIFTKYDEFSRPVYTGILYSPASRQAQVNVVEGMALNIETRSSSGWNNSGMNVFYTNSTAYPTTNFKLLTVNYYDTYPPELTAIPQLILDQPAMAQELDRFNDASTKGLLTASYPKNIEDDNWTKTYYFYDTKARAIATYTTNHLGGYTNTQTRLDFAGLPQESYISHKRTTASPEVAIEERFTYDHQNRLLVHKHKVDSNPEEILARNSYNEISQLETKKVGGKNIGSPLQTVNYQYNIRGWMTQINDPSNLGNDLFGYKINYNLREGQETPNNDYSSLKVKPRFNGNIAEIAWKTLTEENEPLKRYGYAYDGLNRLSAGFYQKQGSETAKEYFEIPEYDLNGNITRLKRSAALQMGNTAAIVIDNLKYDYTGNKLTKVTDLQQNPSGYPYLANPGTIGYDNDNGNGNGNMTSHPDKGISSIQYNYLNLPKQITQNAKVTNYTYRADGVKVKKLFGDIETDYLDGFQYKSTKPSEAGDGWVIVDPNEVAEMKLRIIPTSEGYYDALSGRYVYHYTDHLGNVRLSYTDANKDGIIQPRKYQAMKCTESPAGNVCYMDWRPGEIVEMNDYYPFGLLHNYTVTTQNAYQYKYQGQELQETGFYSFKWRNYMPDVARFFNIDPLAEKYPTWGPYVFSGNRVIDARELEGLEPVVLTNIEGKMIVDFHVKVTPKSDMTTQNINDHLSYVSTILSQNSGLQINMINNPKATFGLDMTKPYQSKKTTFYKDGKVKIEMILGEARVGNPINQTITSNGSPKVTAHEIAHTLGLEHIWEDPNVSNTPENIKNLQNSDGNIISDMQENSGTDILPQQVEKMKKVIEASQARINKDELTKTNKDETTK